MKYFAGLLLSFLIIGVSTTYAGIRPSFWLDHCSWEATHIVVATEGDEIDGHLTVLESWKGDLKPGEEVIIPELTLFKSQSSRMIKTLFETNTDGPASYLNGQEDIRFRDHIFWPTT